MHDSAFTAVRLALTVSRIQYVSTDAIATAFERGCGATLGDELTGVRELKALYPGAKITVIHTESGSNWTHVFYNGRQGDDWEVEMVKKYTAYLDD